MKNSKKNIRLVLGSQSPRRRMIIDDLGIPYFPISPDANEDLPVKDPREFALEVVKVKANAVRDKLETLDEKVFLGDGVEEAEKLLILTSDTIVVHNEEILGKPADIKEARTVLRNLRGQTHLVITSVALTLLDKNLNLLNQDLFTCDSSVTFWNFTDTVLESYLALEDSLDKAGSYGLQGPGMVLVEKIDGSYSNVIGLPLDRTIKKIYDLLDIGNRSWKDVFL